MTRNHRRTANGGSLARRLATAGAVLAAIGTPLALAGPARAEQCHGTEASCAPWAAKSKPGGTVARSEVLARARTWVGNEKIHYSQSGRYDGPGGLGSYRRDCSGFVAMALHMNPAGGGPNTVSLAADVHRIAAKDLEPGDVLGRIGPGTGGDDGHVRMFVKWANASHTEVVTYEQGWIAKDTPHQATYPVEDHLDSGAALLPYRYDHIG